MTSTLHQIVDRVSRELAVLILSAISEPLLSRGGRGFINQHQRRGAKSLIHRRRPQGGFINHIVRGGFATMLYRRPRKRADVWRTNDVLRQFGRYVFGNSTVPGLVAHAAKSNTA